MSERAPFRAADVVKHGPSRETWRLACDEAHGSVWPSGWPEARADASDCKLVNRSSDEERIDTLRRVANGQTSDYRQRLASSQLAAVDPAYSREVDGAELTLIAETIHQQTERLAKIRGRHGRDFVRNRTRGALLDAVDAAAHNVRRREES